MGTMRTLSYACAVTLAALCLTSCEGCVRKVAKKATAIGLSAVEGASEAISEHGEAVGEKATDALGSMAKGAGRSLDKLLGEHADTVSALDGRAMVQSMDALDTGAAREYYDEPRSLSFTTESASGASLALFGKIKSKPVVDAYFVMPKEGTYDARFVFSSADRAVLMEKRAALSSDSVKRFVVVSFALDDDELERWQRTSDVSVSMMKK